MKPALHCSYRIFHLHYLVAYIYLTTIEESVDLDIIAFDRFLRSSFDLEHGSVVLSIFADVVQHQLRLTRSTESPHD